ncbi:MAG: SUMF1/EgtB/PvdO family nonheme iron enzyme [Chloroflexi bacterium]|nr:SUMF1/EgtB/PvdO family nonheme iron enzyme [Chloroflexota bacterium]
MTPMLGDYLVNLAAELSAHVLAAIPGWVKSSWQGDETDTAVRRCLDAGIAAFIRRAQANAPAYEELWRLIFPRFFHDADVAAQVARLLEGQNLNRRALQFMAGDAGYQPDRFPDLDFDAALQEFEGAFLIQAVKEPTLQGIIEAAQLLEQTKLLAGTQALLAEIVALLDTIKLKQIAAISADSITATNVVGGDQHVYQLAPQSVAIRFPDHWESHYLQALIAQCDRLDTTPLSAGEATAETLSIAAVFTTLFLENAARAEDETVTEALSPKSRVENLKVTGFRGRKPATGRRQDGEMVRLTSITASEAIAAMPRLVILGQPGGGKSTLVNYVAAQLARRRLGEDAHLADWPDGQAPLPVRIILRRFAEWMTAEKRIGSAGDVWDYLAYLLGRWGCADSFDGLRHTLIEAGGLIFFDGLDEIREAAARQAIIKGAVTDFAATEKACQIIVTSRPYAYADKAKWRLPDRQFPVVTLAPFADEQIKTFNKAWYTRVMGPRRGWDADQCQQRAALLTQTLFNLPHLRRLAESPLLLTLIAQVHGQGGTLPDNRADLYRQTVELLLSRWENRIVLDARPGETVPADEALWLGVSTSHLRDVLAQIAYRAHKRQGEQADQNDGDAAEIGRAELKLALVERFDSGELAEQIMAYIQHRAGLLLAQAEDTYTFPHRTFQEYLTAQYLLSKSDGQQALCQLARERPDWWREVFLLSAGSSMTVPKNVQDLVNTLLPFDPGSPKMPLTQQMPTQVAIGAQALLETNFQYHVEQEEPPGGYTAVYHRVQLWLQTIMIANNLLPAKTRAEAGQWLARLGDERPGVGVNPETGLPDIVWGDEVPMGTYRIGDNEGDSGEKPRNVTIKRPYSLSRYPITNAQFQCFLDAKDRNNPKWWQGLPEKEREFDPPRFPHANHPRETVSWYQAIAFCRWLNNKLDGEIGLPHEYEWEVAARWNGKGTDGRLYPWQGDFDANKANTYGGKRIEQTTAVGIYPSGKNVALELYDLSGNVWEWCVNEYDKPEETAVDNSRRVLRGGSWSGDQGHARAASRYNSFPDSRSNGFGFRVVVVRRPPSHHVL